MEYEWDQNKARQNFKKHGVDFADAVTALEDELALTIDDEWKEEDRFLTLGVDAQARLLVVSWTLRADRIRLISARQAEPAERRDYES